MKETAGTKWIEALRERTYRELLQPAGFRTVAAGWWVRSNGWKLDSLRIANKGAGIAFVVTYEVLLPPSHDCRNDVDFNNVAYGSPDSALERDPKVKRVPLLRSSRRRFAESCIRDISATLNWFDAFSTPEQCLDIFSRSELADGSPRGRSAEEYLQMVIDGGHDAYLAGLASDCSDFTRKLFFPTI